MTKLSLTHTGITRRVTRGVIESKAICDRAILHPLKPAGVQGLTLPTAGGFLWGPAFGQKYLKRKKSTGGPATNQGLIRKGTYLVTEKVEVCHREC